MNLEINQYTDLICDMIGIPRQMELTRGCFAL